MKPESLQPVSLPTKAAAAAYWDFNKILTEFPSTFYEKRLPLPLKFCYEWLKTIHFERSKKRVCNIFTGLIILNKERIEEKGIP